MAKRKRRDETWEIDLDSITLDDLEILEGNLRGQSATQTKELLARLVANKTAKDIGKIPLGDLRKHLAKLRKAIVEEAAPKENATP